MSEQEEKDLKAENLELWRTIGKTDPKFTKEATTKGGFTSISAYYQIEVATGVFGVYGKDWGLKDIKVDYSLLELTGLATMEAVFYCPKSTFSINNAISVKAVGSNYVDADFMKKLQTNTITKALSLLGMSNDVFKGQFDDHEYVAERKAEAEMAETEDKEKLSEERFNEVKKYVQDSIATMNALPTTTTVDNFKNKTLSKVRSKLNSYKFKPETFDKKIIDAAEARINAIRGIQAKDQAM